MCAKKSSNYRSSSSSEEDSPYSIKNSKKNQKKGKIEKPVQKKQHKKVGKPMRGGPGGRKRGRAAGINHLNLNNKDELMKKLESRIKRQFLEYLSSIGFKKGLVMKENDRVLLKKEQDEEKLKPERSLPEIQWDPEHEWIRTEQFEKLNTIFKKFEIKYPELHPNLENYENFYLNISSLFARQQTSEIYHILMQLYTLIMHFPEALNSKINEEQIALIKNFSSFILECNPMKDMSMEEEFGFLQNASRIESFLNYPYCFFNKKFTKQRKKLKIDESEVKKEKLDKLLLNTARAIKILQLNNNKGDEEIIKLELMDILTGQKVEKNENEDKNVENEEKSSFMKIENTPQEPKNQNNELKENNIGDPNNNIQIQKEHNLPQMEIENQNQQPVVSHHSQEPIHQQNILQQNSLPAVVETPKVSVLAPRKKKQGPMNRKTYSYKFRVIGMMSGTSLDGVDLSYCEYYKYLQPEKQKWKYRLITAKTYEYSHETIEILKKMTNPGLSHLEFLECQRIYSYQIVQKIKMFIQNQINKKDSQKNQVIDFICLHGHTIFHQPAKSFTIQAANLNLIAAQLETDVIGNFRQLDVHRGGHGAPLAPYGQQLFQNWVSSTQEQISRLPQVSEKQRLTIYLNLGGIANIGLSVKEGGHKQIFGTDIAFCNIVLNHISKLLNNQSFDKLGQLGRQGKFNKEYYTKLLNFFPSQPFPISLGKEQIDILLNQITLMSQHSTREQVLSFARMYYEFLADKITQCIYEWGLIKFADPYGSYVRILCTGGGTYNTFMIQLITHKIQIRNRHLKAHVDFQIPSKQIIEFKESIVFGLLGVKCYLGEPNCERGIGGMLVKGGKGDGSFQNDKGEKKEACFDENVKIFSYEPPMIAEEQPVYPKLDTTIQECYRIIRSEEENKSKSANEDNNNQKRYFIELDFSQWK